MSDFPAPPSRAGVQRIIEELDPDDQHVLEQPISEERVATLQQEIENGLAIRGLRPLFAAADALEVQSEYEAVNRYGNRIILSKGSFVEGSDWFDARSGTFIASLEIYREKRLSDLLHERLETGIPLANAEEVLEFVRDARQQMTEEDAPPDVVFISGRLSTDLDVELANAVGWDSPQLIRGVEVTHAIRGGGQVDGLPVVQYFAQDSEPAVFVVALNDFSLAETPVAEDDTRSLILEVTEIDETRAVELIDERPEFRRTLYASRTDGDSGEYTRTETIVQMQLKVEFDLTAASSLTERRVPRTRGARITDVEPQDGQS